MPDGDKRHRRNRHDVRATYYAVYRSVRYGFQTTVDMHLVYRIVIQEVAMRRS